MYTRITYPVSLHVFDPLNSLSLWVHHQRPPVALSHYHTILSGEGIRRQSLDVPVSHTRWLAQKRGKGVVWTTRNVQRSYL